MLALSIKNICSKPTSSTCYIIKEECFVLDPSKISVIPRARLSLLWRSDNWQDSLRDVQPHKSQIQLTPSDEAVKWRFMRKYLWHLFIPKVLTRRVKIWVFLVIFSIFSTWPLKRLDGKLRGVCSITNFLDLTSLKPFFFLQTMSSNYSGSDMQPARKCWLGNRALEVEQ